MNSPYTPEPNPLLTRDDMRRAFLALERPLLLKWDDDKTDPDLGPHRAWYGLREARLEIVTRYLYGLVPFTAGGGTSAGWTHVLDAIVHGTDPDHPHYWGDAEDNNQRSVEMAALGYALRLVPEAIWTPLSSPQQDRFARWMAGMVDRSLVVSNWQFFRLLVTMGLRHVGRAPANSDAQDQRAIDVIDRLYLGDGWYEDGARGQRDYYIPMAFHFYAAVLKRFAAGGPVMARVDEWAARATTFGEQFVDWFAADGAALAFGRSLTYRFAQGAYWGGCAVAGLKPFSPGTLKGMHLRHLRWWWRQPMRNGDGTLSLGYSYPNHNILEPYNAAGSPYWAMKSFAPLMLADSDPFWASDEQPLPARPAEPARQPRANFLIDRDPNSGHVTALSAGQWHPGWPLRHRDAKYAKLAYSTAFGPTVGPNHESLTGAGIDATIAIQDSPTLVQDGTPWRCRGETANAIVAADHVRSDWIVRTGLAVRTWLIPAAGAWHARVHRVETDQPIQFAEGGFSADEPVESGRDEAGVCVRGAGESGFSGVVDVSGGRRVDVSDVEPNSSLTHSRTLTPVVIAALPAGTHWLATLIFAAARGSRGAWAERPRVTMVPGERITVAWENREIRIDVAEERPPSPAAQKPQSTVETRQ